MIAAGHEDCDDVQRCRPMGQLSFENLADWRALGPYRARCDRSLLPELRAAAAAHHSRHGRHRRSQQELALLRGDSHYCAEPPRWCCREPCAATTPSASPGTIFARVETTPMGTDVRFSITNPRRARQGALREVFWLTREPDRRHGAPGPVPACSRWQANQLPAHRHIGCCARHRSVRAGWSHLRDDQAHVGEDRRPRRANDRCGTRRGKPSLQPQNAFRLSPRGSARRARPTTMAGGRGGGLCRTGGSPRFQGLPVAPMMILDTTDGLSASYRSCRSIGYKSSIRAITSFLPCRHGYGRVDRRPFSLLPRRRLPS